MDLIPAGHALALWCALHLLLLLFPLQILIFGSEYFAQLYPTHLDPLPMRKLIFSPLFVYVNNAKKIVNKKRVVPSNPN